MAVKWLLLVDIYSLYQSQKQHHLRKASQFILEMFDSTLNSSCCIYPDTRWRQTLKKNSYVYVSQLNSEEWKHLKIVLGLKKACAVHRTCIQTSSTVNYRLNISHFWQVGQARSFPRAHRILELTSLAGN